MLVIEDGGVKVPWTVNARSPYHRPDCVRSMVARSHRRPMGCAPVTGPGGSGMAMSMGGLRSVKGKPGICYQRPSVPKPTNALFGLSRLERATRVFGGKVRPDLPVIWSLNRRAGFALPRSIRRLTLRSSAITRRVLTRGICGGRHRVRTRGIGTLTGPARRIGSGHG